MVKVWLFVNDHEFTCTLLGMDSPYESDKISRCNEFFIVT
jgi:hypothetical protein